MIATSGIDDPAPRGPPNMEVVPTLLTFAEISAALLGHHIFGCLEITEVFVQVLQQHSGPSLIVFPFAGAGQALVQPAQSAQHHIPRIELTPLGKVQAREVPTEIRVPIERQTANPQVSRGDRLAAIGEQNA